MILVEQKKNSVSHKGKAGHPVSEEVRKKISEKTKMAMNKDVCQKISEKK